MSNLHLLPKKILTLRKTNKYPRRCFVGFDGFTDHIISVVDQRHNAQDYTTFNQISDFASRLKVAAGKSCNIEFICKRTKLGGNAPILANALLEGGHHLIFAGTIGEKTAIEPLFLNFANRCKQVFPLGPSGQTDALEFNDGKIFLGKLESLSQILAQDVIFKIGEKNLLQILDESDLFISANWTMLPMMTDLWIFIQKKITCHLSKRIKKRRFFVDLADPAKRSDSDLRQALGILSELNHTFALTLGLNEAESLRLCSLYSLDLDRYKNLEALAVALRQATSLDEIVIHRKDMAAVAFENGNTSILGKPISSPLTNTGAGDHFNAGYCHALLFQLSPLEALAMGMATANIYVRTAKSPNLEEISSFIATNLID